MKGCLNSIKVLIFVTGSQDDGVVEKGVCTRLGHVINTFHELLQTAIPLGPALEAIIKVLNKLYLVLTVLVKWVSI